MYLKTLTLRGFKSFASATTLRLEPGITCVVGPNGSGKSNVVDALAWVMGEQGAKSLRGGKMEDVIFAGTTGRAPLGRAEVALTIDNGDGALPIDYSEVTISRIMFRNGGSEYAINGDPCRLLDIQELLSDSGIGREMHVILGQGRLDAVLQASAEDRRTFIEEAAGVLKHRKRKEKALRKLDAMQANLTRLTDLTGELRRQLKPLGRQAEVARRAVVIQADLRDARLRLLADDLVGMREAFEQEAADEEQMKVRRKQLEHEYASAQAQESELEQRGAALVPYLAQTQETWYRLSSLKERYRGSAQLAVERVRSASRTAPEERHGRDPEEMQAEAMRIREEEAELAEEIAEAQETLAGAVMQRTDAETALQQEERRLAASVRAAADQRENLAKLDGRVGAMRSKAAAADAEIGRLGTAAEEARGRAAGVQREYDELKTEVEGLETDGGGLDDEVEQASQALSESEEKLTELRAAEREAQKEHAGFAARKEALELGLNRKDGAGALLAATDRLSGLLGSVAAILTVESGAEAAVAAALGHAADAVAVTSVDSAVNAIRLLKAEDAGQATVIVGGDVSYPDDGEWPQLPEGARYVIDLIQVQEELRPAFTRLLNRMAVVEDLSEASELIARAPDVRAVTRDGDVLGRDSARGGSSSAPTLLEVQAAVDEAAEKLYEAGARAERLRTELEFATAERQTAKARVDALMAQRREADSQKAGVAQQLGRLGGQARAALGEVERFVAAIEKAEEARDRDLGQLEELEGQLLEAQEAAAAAEELEDASGTDRRDDFAQAATAARTAEMEARLAVRTAEERARALAGRADQLDRAAQQEREARERAIERAERLAEEAEVARAVAHGFEQVIRHLEQSLALAQDRREQAERSRVEHDAEIQVIRTRVRELSGELEKLTDSVHRDEVARAERRMRIEQMEEKALAEHGVEADVLVAEYGPDVPIPPTVEGDIAVPYDRAEQQRRLKKAEKDYTALGKVNPLALEEFAALEERHQFLSEQLEDLKKTRKDLLDIIKEVDDRVEQVFTEAYADVAREFEGVFSRLFPGGDGRLILTDPDDMLTTGIEVEARPPGKKVKRLSLLSGGERSLTAVAFLVSIFKARPSPFYIMDEVEAALDDTNLGRLINIMEELRATSQLIVITHQKRTMEVADALYGVTMRGDGVTTVISQKLRDKKTGAISDAPKVVPAQAAAEAAEVAEAAKAEAPAEPTRADLENETV
ncbi:chromosome segregation protein SMC [Catenulispora sp. NF23]|uniref:Chromosome partition protein Smc n=1 Tax=Catenulispora pinistramenti TaxID=2705254 RepID=A0ABS5L345_9ACTN|nr:chromosome segregation protein SMC [Catenulispora pinistramenti]MBS2537878.1 chromosome segregation protein SMC [Catenulispora pinistramenti]MBS2552649.1 chromosome segregation protein SMC [Catenulispora pinistramenti]